MFHTHSRGFAMSFHTHSRGCCRGFTPNFISIVGVAMTMPRCVHSVFSHSSLIQLQNLTKHNCLGGMCGRFNLGWYFGVFSIMIIVPVHNYHVWLANQQGHCNIAGCQMIIKRGLITPRDTGKVMSYAM